MNEEYKDLELINNTTDHRFELNIDGYIAFIEYAQTPSHVILIHTEAPDELKGKGAGTAVIEKTLDYIEKHHIRMIPRCPFILAYLKRHPQWNRLVD